MKMGFITALFGLFFQVDSQSTLFTTGVPPSTMGFSTPANSTMLRANSSMFINSNSTIFTMASNLSMNNMYYPYSTSTTARPMMMSTFSTSSRPIAITKANEPPSKFGESCKTLCSGEGVNCQNGTCVCFASDATYSKETSKCQRKLGSPCKNGTSTGSYCSSGALCLSDVCTCPSNSKPIDDFTCTLPIWSECKGKGQCNPSLSCIDNHCTCPNVYSTMYLENECYSFEGGSCAHDGLKCLNNSECVGNVCRCKTGYINDEEGNCHPSQGSPCAVSMQSSSPKGYYNPMMKILPLAPSCKENSGLVCIEGTCECPDTAIMSFNTRLHKCELRVGVNCEYRFVQKITSYSLGRMGNDQVYGYGSVNDMGNLTCENNGVCGMEEGKSFRTCKMY